MVTRIRNPKCYETFDRDESPPGWWIGLLRVASNSQLAKNFKISTPWERPWPESQKTYLKSQTAFECPYACPRLLYHYREHVCSLALKYSGKEGRSYDAESPSPTHLHVLKQLTACFVKCNLIITQITFPPLRFLFLLNCPSKGP